MYLRLLIDWPSANVFSAAKRVGGRARHLTSIVDSANDSDASHRRNFGVIRSDNEQATNV